MTAKRKSPESLKMVQFLLKDGTSPEAFVANAKKLSPMEPNFFDVRDELEKRNENSDLLNIIYACLENYHFFNTTEEV